MDLLLVNIDSFHYVTMFSRVAIRKSNLIPFASSFFAIFAFTIAVKIPPHGKHKFIVKFYRCSFDLFSSLPLLQIVGRKKRNKKKTKRKYFVVFLTINISQWSVVRIPKAIEHTTKYIKSEFTFIHWYRMFTCLHVILVLLLLLSATKRRTHKIPMESFFLFCSDVVCFLLLLLPIWVFYSWWRARWETNFVTE